MTFVSIASLNDPLALFPVKRFEDQEICAFSGRADCQQSFLLLSQFWCTWERLCMNQVRSLLSMNCMLLGYNFVPYRSNSCVLGTIELSYDHPYISKPKLALEKPVWQELKQDWLVQNGLRATLKAWSMQFKYSLLFFSSINPLSPNIHIQILQTDLHTSPLRISWENLIKGHGIFSIMIISLILITLSLDSVWILLGETCCWSLLGLKGLRIRQKEALVLRCQ